MFVKLSQERIVQVVISHKKEEVIRSGHLTNRQTYVTIKEDNKTLLQGVTYCSELDNFSKFEGRKKALKKALSSDANRAIFTKDERALLFKAVCPKVPNQKDEVPVEVAPAQQNA